MEKDILITVVTENIFRKKIPGLCIVLVQVLHRVIKGLTGSFSRTDMHQAGISPILAQCSISIPPENFKKPKIF